MKLQTRLLLILIPVFLLAMIGKFASDYYSAQEAALSDMQREARNIHGVLMATRRVYHHQFIDSELPLNDKTLGFLPAHSMSRISQDFKSWTDSGLIFNNVSDRPRNPTNRADSVELEAMAYFRVHRKVEERFVPFTSESDESYYHYSRPIWVEQYCLKCHGDRDAAPKTIRERYDSAFDYEVGDLRGVMSIKLPAATVEDQAMASASRHFWFNLAIFGIVFALIYWLLIRYAVRRLKKLQASARRLADGDFGSETGITGGDEVAHVASVFDSMARKLGEREKRLRKSRDEIELANRELRRQSKEVQAATQAKSDFLANMSHELRTPLTAILGFADILLDNEDDEFNRTEATTIIKTNGEHLLCLINDILDLSKVEAEKIDLEWIDSSPLAVINDALSLVKVQADAKSLPITTTFQGSIPETIRTDPTRLRQVLINLLGNAIKFTEAGTIQIVTSLEVDSTSDSAVGQMLRIDVIDTGIGMSPGVIDQLFEAFSQADSSTTRQFGGTGLGLTISRRLVEMLGGEISVSSTPGKGSVFSVTVATGPLEGVRLIDPSELPLLATNTPGRARLFDSQPLENVRVLLAEDGPDNQRLISHLLRKSGAEVTVAENGQIAVDLALEVRESQAPFDLILMDMQMPVLDGFDATAILRAANYTGPIVALTAHAMNSDQKKCRDAGCNAYETKPIIPKKLIALVARYACRTKNPEGREANLEAGL